MRTIIGSAVTLGLLLAGQAPAAELRVDYLRQVKPLLTARCYACHGALKQRADLRLDTAAFIQKGGKNGQGSQAGGGANPGGGKPGSQPRQGSQGGKPQPCFM